MDPRPCIRVSDEAAMLITSAIISGLGLGSMYGLIALGFHVTYVVSNTVNFSARLSRDVGRGAGLHICGDARLAVAAGRSMALCCARCSVSSSSALWCGRSPIAARMLG